MLADLSGRAVTVPGHDEHVAAGACVLAAAALAGTEPAAITTTWDLGTGTTVEPDPGVDRDTIRAAYAAARARG